jgi:hypothetical protein
MFPKTRFRDGLLCAGATLAVLSSSQRTVHADLYEFTFTGEVTYLDGELPYYWEHVELGSPWELTYLIDSEAPDKGGGAFSGRYLAESASVSLGGVGIDAVSAEVRTETFPPVQEYQARLFLPFDKNSATDVELYNSDGVLENDHLPLDLDLDDWPGRLFELGIPFQAFVQGNVLTLSGRPVPNPGTLIIATFAMTLGRKRRRP